MPRNIEVKARLDDRTEVEARVAALADHGPERIAQEDIFFPASHGRLKLRLLGADRGQLIFYERADRHGPRLSAYRIAPTHEPHALAALLDAALGRRAVVRKVRTLYLIGRTRVHLDAVEGLGEFLELEVVLGDGEIEEEASREAHALMAQLGIGRGMLVDRAYVDLLTDG